MTQPQAAYRRETFSPTRPIKPGCPLCWDNQLLKGGRVLARGRIFFVYVFETEDGNLKDCFIAPYKHHPDMTTLPRRWGREFGRLYARILREYKIQAHNGYWNEGYAAGQRILGHWHVRIDVAPAEESPAYAMGLALLRKTFNEKFA